MAIQASKTCKGWIFLNPSMCYSGCFWDTGRWFTNFSEFFSTELSQWFYCNFSCLLHDPSPLFIVLFLRSRGAIDSPILTLGYQSPFCAHRPEGWVFLISHFFSSFWCCFLESPWLSIYFGVHLFLMSRFSWFSFWPSFLFIFFLKWAESHPAGLKVLCCYSPFYSPLFWFPEYCPLALWEVTPGFLLFLAGSLVLEKDVSILCFLCSFGFSFELS